MTLKKNKSKTKSRILIESSVKQWFRLFKRAVTTCLSRNSAKKLPLVNSLRVVNGLIIHSPIVYSILTSSLKIKLNFLGTYDEMAYIIKNSLKTKSLCCVKFNRLECSVIDTRVQMNTTNCSLPPRTKNLDKNEHIITLKHEHKITASVLRED
jgi:hypothetical protein